MHYKRALLTGVGLALISTSIYAETLTVTSWGGAYSMSQRKAYHEPFMKETGNVVLEDEWAGELAAVRSMVETNNYKWDIIDVETGPAIQGCDEGIFEPLDREKLGLDEDDFIEGGLIECGLGTITWATVLAYRTDVYSVDSGPQNWADFFDTAKFAGKRSLYKPSPQHNFAIALQADGVAADEVWNVLRSEEGVDRAFDKLSSIKGDMIWWETGAMAPQLLADKEVVMASGWNGRFYSAVIDDNQPFHLVWDGQIYDFGYFVIPAGSPKMELAYEYLRFAGRPDRQGDQTNYISYGNARKGTEPYANPDILPHLPTYPPNLANAVKADAQWWADNGEDLTQRWNTWIAK
ncbi:MAG: spermidine/putrescine ABC transporter substrate-binding protein [Thiotrichales bacterium]|nr:spermidine/putrescine ABC transporter substrate-binding protein [Thiotrichales bacterium]